MNIVTKYGLADKVYVLNAHKVVTKEVTKIEVEVVAGSTKVKYYSSNIAEIVDPYKTKALALKSILDKANVEHDARIASINKINKDPE